MRGYATNLNREKKAKKIVEVLEDYIGGKLKNYKILDIGVGNGGIAQYLAQMGNEVYGVDVQEVPDISNKGFKFMLVNNERLPFDDNSFDIVISNMVIEHVLNGKLHMSEIKRVLRGGGICYLGLPNRNFPYEVHTHTLFIHYFPDNIFSLFLKVMGKYKEPIHLISYRQMKKMIKQNGFVYKDYTIEIINNPNKYYINNLKVKMPRFMSRFSMTNIWILQKQGD